MYTFLNMRRTLHQFPFNLSSMFFIFLDVRYDGRGIKDQTSSRVAWFMGAKVTVVDSNTYKLAYINHET